MSFGLRDFLRTAANDRIDACGQYLEFSKGWSRVSVDAGELVHTPMQPSFRTELVDQVPILDLIRANVDLPVAPEHDGHPANPNIEALTASLVKSRWDWKAVFKNYGLMQAANELSKDDGFRFEVWMLALVRALGARQAKGNIELRRTSKLMESDTVCLHGGRLILLDLKLEPRGAKPMSAQLRVTRITAEVLGGLSAKGILIRPLWSRLTGKNGEDFNALTRALNVIVLDVEDCKTLASRLVNELHLPEQSHALATRIDAMLRESPIQKPPVTQGVAQGTGSKKPTARNRRRRPKHAQHSTPKPERPTLGAANPQLAALKGQPKT